MQSVVSTLVGISEMDSWNIKDFMGQLHAFELYSGT